jgi:hypothetical protein
MSIEVSNHEGWRLHVELANEYALPNISFTRGSPDKDFSSLRFDRSRGPRSHRSWFGTEMWPPCRLWSRCSPNENRA